MSIRALVTGGAGFIGSHLTESLLERGDQVTVLDDQSTGNLGNLATVAKHPRLQCISGSAGDEPLVRRLVADADHVFHLAAAVGVALIASKPLETIERNIGPTQMLLQLVKEQCQQGRPMRFFLASTSEVYGKNPKECWTEDDDLVFGPTVRARWSYGASKAIDEFLALAHWREYQVPVVIGRFFNVVGPRQSGAYGMVLPRFVQAALVHREIVVHDDGRQIRCFAHVSDVIASVLQLMECPPAIGEVVNVGSSHAVSILELARRVIELSGSRSQVVFQSYTDAYDKDFEDIRRRVPDLSKLQRLIQYRPRFDLDSIIQDVIRSFGG